MTHLSKVIVAISFLATLAFITYSVTIVWQIDSNVAALGAAATIMFIAVALMLGLASPDDDIGKLWKRLTLGWVAYASKNRFLVAVHFGLMVIIAFLAYLAGLGSIHDRIDCQQVLATSNEVKLFWRDLLGKDVELSCNSGQLTRIWTPLAPDNKIYIRATQENHLSVACVVNKNILYCPTLAPPSDFAIKSVIDSVDFREWVPYSMTASRRLSRVNRTFDIQMTRLKDNVKFDRSTSTSSNFGLDCRILNSEGVCNEVHFLEGQADRRVWQLILDDRYFPLNQLSPLRYQVSYFNSYSFSQAKDNSNICTGCDILFTTLYPVERYQLHVTFPLTWSWKRILVVTAAGDGFANQEPGDERNDLSSSEFDYSPPNGGSLKAGTHIEFYIFPDSRLPRSR